MKGAKAMEGPEAKLTAFAERIHLQDEDVDYLLTLMQEARGLGSIAGAKAVNAPKDFLPAAMGYLDPEREAIAQLVETATDAHDLHDIARRIRARKEQP